MPKPDPIRELEALQARVSFNAADPEIRRDMLSTIMALCKILDEQVKSRDPDSPTSAETALLFQSLSILVGVQASTFIYLEHKLDLIFKALKIHDPVDAQPSTHKPSS